MKLISLALITASLQAISYEKTQFEADLLSQTHYTYENTLKIWNQFSVPDESAKDLLKECCKIILEQSENPFEKYIMESFLQEDFKRPEYFAGLFPEQEIPVPSAYLLEFLEDSSEEILDINPDSLYIHTVSIDEAYILYNALEEHYAHIVYIPTLDQEGVFIASKCSLEQARFALLEILEAEKTYTSLTHSHPSSSPLLLIREQRSNRDYKDKNEKGEFLLNGDIVFEWGGEDGFHWQSNLEAKGTDKNGNYGKTSLRRGFDGKYRASVGGGNKYDEE